MGTLTGRLLNNVEITVAYCQIIKKCVSRLNFLCYLTNQINVAGNKETQLM